MNIYIYLFNNYKLIDSGGLQEQREMEIGLYFSL